MELYNTLLKIFNTEIMIDKEIREAGHTWKSLSELLGENPSNFKRKLVQNVERINKWLEPLNLQILIASKSEGGEEKNKRKG
jgi:hypothetical protein